MKKMPKTRIPLPKKPPKVERDEKKEASRQTCRVDVKYLYPPCTFNNKDYGVLAFDPECLEWLSKEIEDD